MLGRAVLLAPESWDLPCGAHKDSWSVTYPVSDWQQHTQQTGDQLTSLSGPVLGCAAPGLAPVKSDPAEGADSPLELWCPGKGISRSR